MHTHIYAHTYNDTFSEQGTCFCADVSWESEDSKCSSSCTHHLFPFLSWARAPIANTRNGTPRLWCCYDKLREPQTHARKLGEGCEEYTLCWTVCVQEASYWKAGLSVLESTV